MKRTLIGAALGVLVAAVLVCVPQASWAQPGSAADREALAQKLVKSAAIREGDLVQISGGVRDAELLEDLAVEVRKAGAHPLISLVTDRLIQKILDKVPARYDSQAPAFSLKMADTVAAQIFVDFNEDPAFIANVAPARRAAIGKASEPVGQLTLKRNVRQVYLGNGLYPTAKTAQRFGISQETLAKVFWDGVNVDYAKLQSTGEAVRSALASGKELHVVNPNGTDLRMRVEGRPVFVSDGVISSEEAKRGGAACQVWLPAGEVYLAPVPGTAEGKVVVDRQEFDGADIEGLTLTFKAGKVTAMTAKSGLEPFKALYDAAGPGKDVFGVVDIGINPNVRVPPGSRLASFMPAGMVTLNLGNNLWGGGDNAVSFGLASFLPGSTVKVDDKVIVDNGVLK
jgi:leucyl aminopeptidase (aminopeptidase T)